MLIVSQLVKKLSAFHLSLVTIYIRMHARARARARVCVLNG